MNGTIAARERNCNTSEEPLSREDLLIISQAQERLLQERVACGLDPDPRSVRNLASVRAKLQQMGEA